MQKRKIAFLLVSFFFFSCNWEIPEKISVVSEAEYAFTVGDFSKSLSEYISAESIAESLTNDKGFSVYDYNPGKNCSIQEFLIDLPVADIELTVDTSNVDENADKFFAEIEIGKQLKEITTATSEVNYQAQDTVDLGISFNDIFSSLEEQLGENPEFVKNLYPTKLPVYVYFGKPDISELSNITCKGAVFLKVGNEIKDILNNKEAKSTETTENYEIKTSKSDKLIFDENNTVINTLSASSASGYTDLADIIDTKSQKEEKISVVYNVILSGLSKKITLTKEEYAKLKDSSGKISINVRMEFPLAIKLEDGKGGDGITNVDILALSGKTSDEDVFSRDEETDLDDFEKYIDIIESGKLVYKIKNGLFSYEGNTKGSLIFNSTIDGLKNPNYELTLSNGNLKIYTSDVKTMLKTYPIYPKKDIKLNVELPDGTLRIPRNAEFSVNLAVKIKTNGKVTVWEE